MVMFNAFYQISDALFSVLIFYVYIEATDIFDVADALGTKENLVFESASICIWNVHNLIDFFRLGEIINIKVIVAILFVHWSLIAA